MSKVSFKHLPSNKRGHANHGWLNSYHTFSFASYYNQEYMKYGHLRVINEDRVDAGEGFGMHPHNEYEIYSYIVNGELTHRDSINPKKSEVLKRGDVQFTSAGTGMMHSEYNMHPSDEVHFLQIWVKPAVARLKPSYDTKHFDESEKLNALRPIVSPEGDKLDCITIHQDVTTYASILEQNKEVDFTLAAGRKALLQLIITAPDVALTVQQGNEKINVKPGDVLFMSADQDATIKIIGNGQTKAEFLLFDIGN
jgi:redox-sensitive bicupin YhaK (pirin superfamily)